MIVALRCTSVMKVAGFSTLFMAVIFPEASTAATQSCQTTPLAAHGIGKVISGAAGPAVCTGGGVCSAHGRVATRFAVSCSTVAGTGAGAGATGAIAGSIAGNPAAVASARFCCCF